MWKTGDPIPCKSCGVLLNMHSVVLKEGDGEGVHGWSCEFCGFQNVIHLEEGEVPTKIRSEYLLELPSNKGNKAMIIFCIDISGSFVDISPI